MAKSEANSSAYINIELSPVYEGLTLYTALFFSRTSINSFFITRSFSEYPTITIFKGFLLSLVRICSISSDTVPSESGKVHLLSIILTSPCGFMIILLSKVVPYNSCHAVSSKLSQFIDITFFTLFS